MEFEIRSVFCHMAWFYPISGLERASEWDEVDVNSCCSVLAHLRVEGNLEKLWKLRDFPANSLYFKRVFLGVLFDVANHKVNGLRFFTSFTGIWGLCTIKYDKSSMERYH